MTPRTWTVRKRAVFVHQFLYSEKTRSLLWLRLWSSGRRANTVLTLLQSVCVCLELPVYSPTRTPVYSEDRYSARAEVWETVLHLLQKTTVQLRPVCTMVSPHSHSHTHTHTHHPLQGVTNGLSGSRWIGVHQMSLPWPRLQVGDTYLTSDTRTHFGSLSELSVCHFLWKWSV